MRLEKCTSDYRRRLSFNLENSDEGAGARLSAWYSLAEHYWYTLAAHHWYILADHARYVLAEHRWYIIARLMTSDAEEQEGPPSTGSRGWTGPSGLR